MKKLFVCLALGVMMLAPSKPVKANGDLGGGWIITIYSSTHYSCTRGGGMCCPGFGC